MAGSIQITYNGIGKLKGQMRERAAAAVKKTAFDIEAHAKREVPVDTGALKNSIQTWLESDVTARVGPHMEYGHYVEFGTRYQAARPYMTPAAEANRQPFIDAMRQIADE